EITMTPVHEAVLSILGGGGALFFRGLADRVVDQITAADSNGQSAQQPDAAGRIRSLNRVSDQAIAAAGWGLVWAGLLTNDTLAPLRTLLNAGKTWAPGPKAPGVPPDQAGLEQPAAVGRTGIPARNGGGPRNGAGSESGPGARGLSAGRMGRRPSLGRG